MTQSTKVNRGIRTNLYVPGDKIDVTEGITEAEFSRVESLSKAIPVEDGFNRCPKAAQEAIIIVNYTMEDIVVVLDCKEKLNSDGLDCRENSTELNGFKLPKGHSSHFVAPHARYHYWISEWVNTENGNKKKITGSAKPIKTIQNLYVDVKNFSQDGLVNDSLDYNNRQKLYSIIKNSTTNEIRFTIKQELTAYPLSLDEEAQIKKDTASVDSGGNTILDIRIEPGAEFHFLRSQEYYWVRAIQSPSRTFIEETNTPNNHPLGYVVDGVPAKEAYSQLAQIEAIGGQVIVFLLSNDRKYIVPKRFNFKELKKVSGSIIVDNTQ